MISIDENCFEGTRGLSSVSCGGGTANSLFGRRERILFMGVVALVVFGVVLVARLLLVVPSAELAVGQNSVGLAGSGQVASQDQVRTVYEGESLWSIARELSDGSDPRPVVDVLVAENGGEVVFVGQEIVIPGEVLD